MINIEIAHFLGTLISLLLAYMVSTTAIGSLRAWVADYVGDDTGKSLGFCTLNPLVHVDPVGLIFLFLFFFGWGRHVPIHPLNIRHPHRIWKLALAYLCRPVGHLLLAVMGIIALVLSFGTRILTTTVIMMSGKSFVLPRMLLARDFPASSSLALSLAFVLQVIVYLNVVLGVLDLIIDGFYFCLLVRIERSPVYREYNNYVLILLPLFLVIFLADFLRTFIVIPFILLVGQLVVALFFGIR